MQFQLEVNGFIWFKIAIVDGILILFQGITAPCLPTFNGRKAKATIFARSFKKVVVKKQLCKISKKHNLLSPATNPKI